MSEKTMRVQDYPLATRCPEHILTPTVPLDPAPPLQDQRV